MYGIYQIMLGDNLESVAKEVGINVEELKKINGINGNVILQPGSLLIVPKYDATYEKYIIKKGDTVYNIAKEKNIDYKSLLKLNGLDEDDYIYEGEILLIPKNKKIYITKEESIQSISNKLGIPNETLIKENPNLVLIEDQVVKY